jgi:hypothetical protein
MWRKKEYDRVYSATKTVKQRQQIKARQKMIDGVIKMEADLRDGMAYSSVIGLKDDKEEKEENCEKPARKRPRQATINVPV